MNFARCTIVSGLMLALMGCQSATIGGDRQRYQPEIHGEANVPNPSIVGREWQLSGERIYKDRNGDGIVDWQNLDGLYREDNDFDGVYETGYESDSVSAGRNFHSQIAKRVPKIHELYPPTYVYIR